MVMEVLPDDGIRPMITISGPIDTGLLAQILTKLDEALVKDYGLETKVRMNAERIEIYEET